MRKTLSIIIGLALLGGAAVLMVYAVTRSSLTATILSLAVTAAFATQQAALARRAKARAEAVRGMATLYAKLFASTGKPGDRAHFQTLGIDRKEWVTAHVVGSLFLGRRSLKALTIYRRFLYKRQGQPAPKLPNSPELLSMMALFTALRKDAGLSTRNLTTEDLLGGFITG